MWKYLNTHKYQLILWLLIIVYITYFTFFTVSRFYHLYAHYFDLGIMHQTVYNTYKGLQTGDFSRILELTSPHKGGEQIKRMGVHNDIFLALLAPLYFIYNGPETLLVVQAVVLGLGAWAVFAIGKKLLKNELLSLSLAFAYLMYSPMQRANIFEFHAVTLATSFILYVFYFWLTGRYRLSFLFLVFALLTKEQVGLSLGMFGLYAAYAVWKKKKKFTTFQPFYFPLAVVLTSWTWSLLSFFLITPSFRIDQHFAAGYYDDVFKNALGYLFHRDTLDYLFYLIGPMAFLTLLAPVFFIIAGPEFAINLLSSNWNLRNLTFHYTSVIQPWMFIGAVYGAKRALNWKIPAKFLISTIILASFAFSYFKSPLPYSREKDIHPILYKREGEYQFVQLWVKRLQDDNIKVSASGQIGPFFASRRYLYNFSEDYRYADYVIISVADVQNGFENDITKPAYKDLQKDKNFVKIDEGNGYQVYKKQL